MYRRSIQYFLVLAVSTTAALAVHAQAAHDMDAGIRPSMKQTTQQTGINSIRAALPPAMSSNGPADPTDPSQPLFCNREVQKQFALAFMKTRNGEERMGLAEAGRSIEIKNGTIAFGPWSTTDFGDGQGGEKANRMYVTKNEQAIAVFHTHGNHARPVPSVKDLQGDVPDFVISQFAVYVTVPGTGAYVQLHPAACR